jgi:Raf kinase inhibitor-like YbhB/YbcL family protein
VLAAALAVFTLASPVFHAGGPIPRRYTCDGNNVSPPLRWTAPPGGTRGFALRLDDPDAPGGTFTHWTLWGLPVSTRTVGVDVRWALQGRNTFGEIGYGGPCPPPGTRHHYVFRVYALDRRLPLRRGASVPRFSAALRGHVLATARITGVYGR